MVLVSVAPPTFVIELYARPTAGGRAVLAIGLSLPYVDDLTVVVPLAARAGAAAPRLLDSADLAGLFPALARAFPRTRLPPKGGGSIDDLPPELDHGAPIAALDSVAAADLAALDRPGWGRAVALASALPDAPSFAWAAFRLRGPGPGGVARFFDRVHRRIVAAVELTPARDGELVFPTRRAIGGPPLPQATHPEVVYCQAPGLAVPLAGPAAAEPTAALEHDLEASPRLAPRDLARHGGLATDDAPLFRRLRRWTRPNVDTRVVLWRPDRST